MVLPALFVSHGAPTIALGGAEAYGRALAEVGQAIGLASAAPPSALVVVSAHFRAAGPVRVTAADRPPLIYDFSGFPDELYRIRYPVPGDPALAQMIAGRLTAAGWPTALEPTRGLDHGAWVPLRLLHPQATVPVVELSLPIATPAKLVELGGALAFLRRENVVVMASGGLVHNLSRVRFNDSSVDPWASAFDDWVASRIAAGDLASLLDYRARAPGASLAVPTSEHFDPLFILLGMREPADRLQPIYEGFQLGNLSLRSFAFAP